MGLVVIVIEAQNVDVFVAGISFEIFLIVFNGTVGRLCDDKVVDAFFAHKVIYRVSEKADEVFI